MSSSTFYERKTLEKSEEPQTHQSGMHTKMLESRRGDKTFASKEAQSKKAQALDSKDLQSSS